jgi:hypothetical protein
MGGFTGRFVGPGRIAPRLLARIFAAALVFVALPTGASADPRVPPPACPGDVSLQGIERAPGGVILIGTVTRVGRDTGVVSLAVDTWFHRGVVPGVARGSHPATIDLALGPGLALAGAVAPARLPAVGSRWLVAGTWAGAGLGVRVTCGVLADPATRVGGSWLARARAHFRGVAPALPASIPVDAPWFVAGASSVVLLLVAMALAGLAQRQDPLPAT